MPTLTAIYLARHILKGICYFMKVFEYWSIAKDAQPFSLYLHNRIGLTKGVTLFVGVILQELEQYNYEQEFVCSSNLAKYWYGVNSSEYRETIKWFKKMSFATVDIVYQKTYNGSYKSTSIKINISEFCIWLQSEKGFTYECPYQNLPF